MVTYLACCQKKAKKVLNQTKWQHFFRLIFMS